MRYILIKMIVIVASTVIFLKIFYESPNLNSENSNTISTYSAKNSINQIIYVNLERQTKPWGISTVKADNLRFKGSNVKVGILDSGIDYHHNDLNVKGGISLVDNIVDRYGIIRSYEGRMADKSNNYMDNSGHGTLIAGIIGAKDNNRGVIGIAPDAELYAIKALNNNSKGDVSKIIAGVEWAIDNDIDVLNMSMGAHIYSKPLENVLKKAYDKGIFIVAPTGNNGYSNHSNINFPAKFSTVFAVGSIDENLKRSRFSNVGNELDIMAPGNRIISTYLDNSYIYCRGTSMATAYITGAVAVLLSIDPTLTNMELEEILKVSSIDSGNNHEHGNGTLDLTSATNYVLLKKNHPLVYNLFFKNTILNVRL